MYFLKVIDITLEYFLATIEDAIGHYSFARISVLHYFVGEEKWPDKNIDVFQQTKLLKSLRKNEWEQNINFFYCLF